MGEESKPCNNTPGEVNAKAHQGGGRNRHPYHCWNQGSSGKFKGKTKEIEFDTFDNTGPHDAVQFNKSLKNIANYLQLNHGNDVFEAVQNLTPVTITVPPIPTPKPDPDDASKILPVTEVDLYLWKHEHNKAQDCKDKYKKNMMKAYIIVFHQCSPTLTNNLDASNTFSTICSNQDVISLLKLIQSLCCLYDAKTQGVMATVASHKRLYTHYQKDRVNNHTYHQEFLAHVETLEMYGGLGVVSVVPTFMAAKIKEMAAANLIADATCPTDAKRMLALNAVRDEYLAALMHSGAHRDRFSGLRTDLKNQYGYGDDRYPKTINACLSLLNRWTLLGQQKSLSVPQSSTPNDQNKEKDNNGALVFTQNANKPSGSSSSTATEDSSSDKNIRPTYQKKPTNVRCKKCNKLGHTSAVCPKSKPPKQVHTINANVDDAFVLEETLTLRRLSLSVCL
jgi:hypothetical protein